MMKCVVITSNIIVANDCVKAKENREDLIKSFCKFIYIRPLRSNKVPADISVIPTAMR